MKGSIGACKTVAVRRTSAVWLRITMVLVAVLIASAAVSAQPPPVGPDSYQQIKTDISVGLLRNFVKTKILEILTNANTQIHAQHPSISVSLENNTVDFNSPFRLPTDDPHRPNQFYVKLPMHFTVKVSIPVTSDRHIYYPLDLNVTCDKWYTGDGTIKITAVTGHRIFRAVTLSRMC